MILPAFCASSFTSAPAGCMSKPITIKATQRFRMYIETLNCKYQMLITSGKSGQLKCSISVLVLTFSSPFFITNLLTYLTCWFFKRFSSSSSVMTVGSLWITPLTPGGFKTDVSEFLIQMNHAILLFLTMYSLVASYCI